MQRLLVFSCLVAFALASYADESCVDTAHAFPTYGADAHLNCWVPQKDANGNPLPPHTICLRISQFATCDTNCKLELNPDPDVGDSATVWRCSSALTYCNQWLEKGSGYDTKVHPLELAGPGETGNKMRNAIPISCIKRGSCTCEEIQALNGSSSQVCKKGNDLDNGDLYQGIEGGAACSIPADPNNPVVPPAGGGGGADPGAGGGGGDPDAGGGSDPDADGGNGDGSDSSGTDEGGSYDDGSYDDCDCSGDGCV